MGQLILITLLECLVNLYDLITLPIYYLIQQPWKSEQLAKRIRSIQVEPNTWVNIDSKLFNQDKSAQTLDELFRDSVSTYGSKKCLGVRKILAVEYKEPPIGDKNSQNIKNKKREIKNYILDDDYTWASYSDIGSAVTKLSIGLTSLCKDSILNSDGSRKVLICADTCMQWFLLAQACFRNNITVTTAYTNLEDDAIVSTLTETEVKIFVINQSFASRVPRILAKAPLVDTIIILDEPLPGEDDEKSNLKPLLTDTSVKRIISYNDLIAFGADKDEIISSKPSKDDVAVLMYTSGSSGKAKAVMLTHESIVYTALSFTGPGEINENDRFIGYLPLGHVLELAGECIFVRNGATIAYSSPMTLTDRSPRIKNGQLGDATIIKPTIIAAVPLVLDRVKNGLQQAIKTQGPFYDQLINDFLIRYKRYWWERYYETPIMNWLICSKFKKVLGGEMRAICSGGAALSKETQEYLRHVTNTIVIQGYGLTETSAAASFSDIYDRRYNTVGQPYPTVRLKLESWSDYSVTDKPYPRGEIIVGGQPVAAGYYKRPELTKEQFFTDPKTGIRYFRTGDIGVMLPDGVLKIIDRKKDIVKPLSGEYISLSAIESALNGEPIVENLCVYCSQYSNYIVAIVRPNEKELRNLATKLYDDEALQIKQPFRDSIHKLLDIRFEGGHPSKTNGTSKLEPDVYSNTDDMINKLSIDDLCSNTILTQACLDVLKNAGIKNNLKKTHIPSRLKLAAKEWNQESGLVTASFKLRRREIERFYENDIKQLYADLGQDLSKYS